VAQLNSLLAQATMRIRYRFRQLSGAVRREERINTMGESLTDLMLYDEEILSNELPDVALEVAASKCWEQAGNPFTIAFCTGLDTCPA
jgi:hypothetical protein